MRLGTRISWSYCQPSGPKMQDAKSSSFATVVVWTECEAIEGARAAAGQQDGSSAASLAALQDKICSVRFCAWCRPVLRQMDSAILLLPR